MLRRQFSGWLVAAGGLGIGWPGRARARLAPVRPLPPADRLVAVFSRPKSAAAVGRAYLAGHPGEAGLDHLVTELQTAFCRRGCEPERADPATLRAAMARLVEFDFAHGRVVRVDGWVLSLSEARLCGLAALLGA